MSGHDHAFMRAIKFIRNQTEVYQVDDSVYEQRMILPVNSMW